MSVGDVVRRGLVVAVGPSSTIREAARVMHENGVGSVLVVDGGRLLGIITERDLVRVVAEGVDLDGPVGEYMTRNPVTLREDDDLHKAVELMVELGVRHLPVVDDKGSPLGVISIRDVVRRLLE